MGTQAGAKSTLRQAGFSLVELMVVVAIIGVLATIAIPRVNRFIAKSRQSEAQVNLSSLYTFNKNFFVEFQGYTSDFDAMGFKPEGNLRYNVGYTQGADGPANYETLKSATYGGDTMTLPDCPIDRSVPRCVTLLGADGNPPADPTSVFATPFQEFEAGATARLVGDGADDTWQISNNKNLRNTHDGTVDVD